MESIVNKLGFFDFFNSIIVGMFTIIGCFCITLQFRWKISIKCFRYLIYKKEVNILFLVLCLFSLVITSYILGILCHSIFDLFTSKENALKKIITRLFEKDSCIENPKRRDRYAVIAKRIFDNNGINYSTTKGQQPYVIWDYELNNYFFTYCLYQVQLRGLDKKPEKFRDIEGLSKSFCVSSVALFFVLIGVGIVSWNTNYVPLFLFWGEAISLVISSRLFYVYRIKALTNRVRLTLSLYDAIYEKESCDTDRITLIIDQLNLY